MNDVALKELKVVVERAVRPVRATMARKRQMREELLAHLVSAFEQAIEKHGDETLALKEATSRFGDPVELSVQLQDSIPWWNRLLLFSEKVVAIGVCNVLLIVVIMFLLKGTPLGRTPYVGQAIGVLGLPLTYPARIYMIVTGQYGEFSILTIVFLLFSNGLAWGLMVAGLLSFLKRKPTRVVSS
jgi:hypothetical protein